MENVRKIYMDMRYAVPVISLPIHNSSLQVGKTNVVGAYACGSMICLFSCCFAIKYPLLECALHLYDGTTRDECVCARSHHSLEHT